MELFFVVKGANPGDRYELTAETVSIGRGQQNQIRLGDAEISRRHAELRLEEGQYVLYDLNSSNGVFVNGQRKTVYRLTGGEHIQIGRTLFLYSHASKEGEEDNPLVDISAEQAGDGAASEIIHSYKQDEGRDLFQIDQEKAPVPGQPDWFLKAKSHLNLIYHTTLAVSQMLDIDRLLRRILDLIFDWSDVDRGCILLYNAETNRYLPKVSRRRNKSSAHRLTISQKIIDYVTTKKEGVLTNDKTTGNGQAMAGIGVREAICVPMLGRYGLVGMIYIDITSDEKKENDSPAPVSSLGVVPEDLSETVTLDSRSLKKSQNTHPKLTMDHLKMMFAIGHQAALAVEDTQYYLAMMQSERLAAVGQTVAVLSHHIKNILQGIHGGSYLIERGLSVHDEIMVGKGWKIVEKNQKKISDLILDMLTFSKERTPVFIKTDMNELLGDVAELMQGRCMDIGVALSFMPGEAIPKTYLDSEQIHRAITNLITNAIDAILAWEREKQNDQDTAGDRGTAITPLETEEKEPSSESGRVELRSAFDPNRRIITITVDDNGPGIPKELRDELFKPFFSKNKSSGTGLGLPVTAKIVHEHKGTIEITDSPLGGARFVVELPFIEENPEESD